MGRKAFGPTKKKACDTRRDCKKKKKSESEVKFETGLKHSRAF
jgi:hypothetical protein